MKAQLFKFLQGQAWLKRNSNYKTGVINDPLGQTHSLASSEHRFHFVLFEKSIDDGRTD